MIGPFNVKWVRNVVGHASRFKEGRQYLRITIYGKKYSGDNDTILTHADVQVYRRKRKDRIEWYGPKGLTVVINAAEPMEISRINVTFPKEIIAAFNKFGVMRREIDVEAGLPRALGAGKTATITFAKPLSCMK
jgi:hypothetical protein